MAVQKPLLFRRLSDSPARRVYLRHFADLPAELTGSAMDKERFLNELSVQSLHVVSVQPRRRALKNYATN